MSNPKLLFDVMKVVPSSDTATNGTVTFNYPGNRTAASYVSGAGARLWAEGLETLFTQGANNFSLSYGGSSVTLTYLGATTIPANTRMMLQAPRADIVDLATSVGTASNTVADVGGSFNQTTLNSNFRSLAEKVNEVIARLRETGLNA